MSDDLDPERAEPVAVGPPRHRMNRLERIRARRTHNRRRLVAALAVHGQLCGEAAVVEPGDVQAGVVRKAKLRAAAPIVARPMPSKLPNSPRIPMAAPSARIA